MKKTKELSDLARYIIRAREKRGWDRAELARAANIPYTTLRHIEESQTDVRTDESNLKAIADAIGTDDAERLLYFTEARVLAGYHVVASQDVAEQDQRLLANLSAYPQLRKALDRMLADGNQEEIDRALTALEVSRQLGVLRSKEPR